MESTATETSPTTPVAFEIDFKENTNPQGTPSKKASVVKMRLEQRKKLLESSDEKMNGYELDHKIEKARTKREQNIRALQELCTKKTINMDNVKNKINFEQDKLKSKIEEELTKHEERRKEQLKKKL